MNYDEFISSITKTLYKDYKAFVESENQTTRLCDELWFSDCVEGILYDAFKKIEAEMDLYNQLISIDKYLEL